MARFVQFQSSFLTPIVDSTPIEEPSQPLTSTEIKTIVLNVRVRYKYDEIEKFIDELRQSNETLSIDDRKFSVFQLYTLRMFNDPVDMSSLTERKIYRPKLFVRKNDKFSPFNFNYLLNLFDIEYEMSESEDEGEFPKLWHTTSDTEILVNVIKLNPAELERTSIESKSEKNEARSLEDIFKIICREQKYDERHAFEWKENFEGNLITFLPKDLSLSENRCCSIV